MVAEGDQVVVTVRMTGTNQGGLPWLNIPANGAKVDTRWVGFYLVRDSKIAEHWAIADIAGMVRQLNAAANA
jgi:predicted ester cyclase